MDAGRAAGTVVLVHGGFAMSVFTDSPASGAKPAM